MDSSVSSTSSTTAAAALDEKLRHLPPEAQAAFRRFVDQGDIAAIDTVVFAILADFAPSKLSTPIAALPAGTRMMEDLGFDSLAITEIVFFTEDLFGIAITNEEILGVRTIDELRTFVRRKVSDRAAAV